MKRIFLINRTRERAAELASDFGAPIEVVDFPDLPGVLSGANLLVNTTSLGMRGQPPLAIDLAPLPPDAVVSDIVYVPLETAVIRAAKARGLRAVSGIGMLSGIPTGIGEGLAASVTGLLFSSRTTGMTAGAAAGAAVQNDGPLPVEIPANREKNREVCSI